MIMIKKKIYFSPEDATLVVKAARLQFIIMFIKAYLMLLDYKTTYLKYGKNAVNQ